MEQNFLILVKKTNGRKSLSVLHAQDIEKNFAETMKKFGYL